MSTLLSVRQLPGFITIKNRESVFLDASYDVTKLLGWKSPDDCYGKTEYDLPCRDTESENADECIRIDKLVVNSGKKIITLEIQNYVSGWKTLLAERNPWKDENENVNGVVTYAVDNSNCTLFRGFMILNQLDSKLIKIRKPVSYILNTEHSPLPLSRKQEICLFLLIRGKTIKQIAKILNKSPRTIECHFDAIKFKLNCHSKSELIEKAINNGFLYYVPECLIKSDFEKVIK
jgi:DNA-binding CsgD family transcriptional regulator